MNKKKLTSFTHIITGEGSRIAYTYSEIDQQGNLISQNNKGNFVVIDDDLLNNIQAIQNYITTNKLK